MTSSSIKLFYIFFFFLFSYGRLFINSWAKMSRIHTNRKKREKMRKKISRRVRDSKCIFCVSSTFVCFCAKRSRAKRWKCKFTFICLMIEQARWLTVTTIKKNLCKLYKTQTRCVISYMVDFFLCAEMSCASLKILFLCNR